MQNYKTVDGASWMKAKKSRFLSHSDCFGSPRFAPVRPGFIQVSYITECSVQLFILLTARWDRLQISKRRQAKAESFAAERPGSYQCNY